MKYIPLLFLLFILVSCHPTSTEKEKVQQIASANGEENFKKVKMLEFVFHAQRDTAAPSSRHWQWFPQTGEVVFITDSATTRFKRNDTTTAELKKLNARFTNDEYWLLFPFHLKWDDGFIMRDSSTKTAPICGKELHKFCVKYNNKEGFTPGDMYDVYVDDHNQIQEWAYHKGGVATPSLVASWTGYKNFNGLQLAQEHQSKDGKFHLWFTDIQVKE